MRKFLILTCLAVVSGDVLGMSSSNQGINEQTSGQKPGILQELFSTSDISGDGSELEEFLPLPDLEWSPLGSPKDTSILNNVEENDQSNNLSFNVNDSEWVKRVKWIVKGRNRSISSKGAFNTVNTAINLWFYTLSGNDRALFVKKLKGEIDGKLGVVQTQKNKQLNLDAIAYIMDHPLGDFKKQYPKESYSYYKHVASVWKALISQNLIEPETERLTNEQIWLKRVELAINGEQTLEQTADIAFRRRDKLVKSIISLWFCILSDDDRELFEKKIKHETNKTLRIVKTQKNRYLNLEAIAYLIDHKKNEFIKKYPENSYDYYKSISNVWKALISLNDIKPGILNGKQIWKDRVKWIVKEGKDYEENELWSSKASFNTSYGAINLWFNLLTDKDRILFVKKAKGEIDQTLGLLQTQKGKQLNLDAIAYLISHKKTDFKRKYPKESYGYCKRVADIWEALVSLGCSEYRKKSSEDSVLERRIEWILKEKKEIKGNDLWISKNLFNSVNDSINLWFDKLSDNDKSLVIKKLRGKTKENLGIIKASGKALNLDGIVCLMKYSKAVFENQYPEESYDYYKSISNIWKILINRGYVSRNQLKGQLDFGNILTLGEGLTQEEKNSSISKDESAKASTSQIPETEKNSSMLDKNTIEVLTEQTSKTGLGQAEKNNSTSEEELYSEVIEIDSGRIKQNSPTEQTVEMVLDQKEKNGSITEEIFIESLFSQITEMDLDKIERKRKAEIIDNHESRRKKQVAGR